MIGLIFGCWDLFHVGHLRTLKLASSMCDLLIVGVYSDIVAFKFKGKYPIISKEQRLEIVENFCRYAYLIKNRPSQANWKDIDVLFVSEEWVGKELPFLPKKFKGKIVYLPYTKEISTSEIKKRITQSSDK